MGTAPQVTVVIPTRNRRRLLERTLASALAQEDVTIEIVVVDDGSTDGTTTWIDGLGDRRIRVLRSDVAKGPAHARNAGLAMAHGAWVGFLDDDDVWAPDKLRRQLDAATRVGATYAYGAAVVFDAHHGVRQIVLAPDPATVRRDIFARNLVPGGCSNLIVRTDVVRAVDGFDERLWTLADWDLWIRVAQTGTGAACPEVIVGYRRHPDSMVVRGEVNGIAELNLLVAKYREHPLASGVRPGMSATYRYFARAHRRAGRYRHAARLYAVSALRDRSPGDLLRALVALLGPIGLAADARLRGRASIEPPAPPAWLVPYL